MIYERYCTILYMIIDFLYHYRYEERISAKYKRARKIILIAQLQREQAYIKKKLTVQEIFEKNS